jgi:NADH-quinone oxidoreductase subunit L
MHRVTDATGAMQLLWLVPALPLAAAALNLFFGKRLGRLAGWLATGAVTTSFLIAALAVRDLLALPADGRLYITQVFQWIHVGGFSVEADLRLDAVSAVMILVVTGVGALIHLYSMSYMKDDPRFGRFFAYLNLFVFFMLTLVLAENFLLLYVGWEGVGLCSYLLIGFWFDKVENVEAAKKAFITTRIGDTAMLVGLALIVMKFGTLDFERVFGSAGGVLTGDAATVISLLLFAGAIGKSAQVPLHVWLPDAMAGPTPVSALIHAATMVTAGVYLVVRSHVLFELSPVALDIVTIVGVVTLLFAGTCALAQWDIKRVLAYSTISQLGYMFVAAGLRAYALAMFFLVAHAFYKALLFLGAGSVIHGMHDEQDMRAMGGLSPKMPITAFTMGVGALALAGAPPLAGYFAKDELLEVANHSGAVVVWILGLLGAVLSAAYIGRLVFLTFFGRSRSEQAEHAHESPPLIWIPLVVLAVGAAAAGLLNPTAEGPMADLLEPIVGRLPIGSGIAPAANSVIGGTIALATILVAYLVWGSGRVDWQALRDRLEPLPTSALRGWYVDRAYDLLLVQPGKAAASAVAFWFDTKVLDGSVNAIGAGVKRAAQGGRLAQTGYVRTYALALFLGAVVTLAFVGFRA